MTNLATPPDQPTYQVGDPSPVSDAYVSAGLPGWDACLNAETDRPGSRVCQWPRTHPHDQHIAVAGYRITAVWND